MKFTGEGQDAEVTGTVDLVSFSDKTKIRYNVEIKADLGYRKNRGDDNRQRPGEKAGKRICVVCKIPT